MHEPPRLELPDVAGWQRSPYESFGRGREGYRLTYEADRVEVVVSVYNPGRWRIPDDVESKEVLGEFDAARDTVFRARVIGVYDAVLATGGGKVRLGEGPQALWASFLLATGPERSQADLYLTVYFDQFVKIECRRPQSEDPAREEALRNLLAHLGTALAR
jgi:hypothetical protein